ncbi:FecCD family ABC transporter permease [Saccharopolyspora spinosa]|uniref:Iron complex transport system permease protein n=1 Tax=Saccharopolyspora spinosa TaxID=60894 RepID=A0A2N3Y4S9_SACSN|nr:iron chelate uptake ABC transporter family permease subunit [Saccharopolyspora spinosa]PKW17907.1 iron complex transport system permease protein [Saccharopolyspora spinosa]
MTALVAVRRRNGFRYAVVMAGLVLTVVGVLLAVLCLGRYPIGVSDVVGSLLGQGSPRVDYVVLRLRLPRALTGLLVGLALGLAGAVFQHLLRNPLASPDVIGVTSGSSLAALLCITVFGASGFVLSAAALVGGLATAGLIYLLAWRRGITGHRLALIGIGVAAVLSSIVSYLMTRSDTKIATVALFWLTGSLNGVDWTDVGTAAALLGVLGPVALVLGRVLVVMQLGDEIALGLGLRVEWCRLALLAVAVGLAAAATAVAGPVAFVAFVSGPISVRLLRTGRPSLLPAAMTGALVTLVADLAAQHLFGGAQLPVGVVTGAVGAPYLLYLLAISNRERRT